MDSFVATIAVAAWLLVMIPAVFVLFLNGADTDADEQTTAVTLALVPPTTADEPEERIAA